MELNTCPSCDAFTRSDWEHCASCGAELSVSTAEVLDQSIVEEPRPPEVSHVEAPEVASSAEFEWHDEVVETPSWAFDMDVEGYDEELPAVPEPSVTTADTPLGLPNWLEHKRDVASEVDTHEELAEDPQETLNQLIDFHLESDEPAANVDAPAVDEIVATPTVDLTPEEWPEPIESSVDSDLLLAQTGVESEADLTSIESEPLNGLPTWSSHYLNADESFLKRSVLTKLKSQPKSVLLAGAGVSLAVLFVVAVAFTLLTNHEEAVAKSTPTTVPVAVPTTVPDPWTHYVDPEGRFTVDFPKEQAAKVAGAGAILTGPLNNGDTVAAVFSSNVPAGSDWRKNDQVLKSQMESDANSAGIAVKSSVFSTTNGVRMLNAHLVSADRKIVMDSRYFVQDGTFYGLYVTARNSSGDPETFARLTDTFAVTKH